MKTRFAILVALLICTPALAQTSLRITTGVPGNLLYVGQPVELKIEKAAEIVSPVDWEIKDLDGKIVASGSESGGSIKPDVKQTGIYYIECRTGDGKASTKTTFAVIHEMPSVGRETSAFGINGGALFHIDLADIPTVGKARLDLCQRLGVKWGRNDFWWGKIEPELQTYNWGQADAAVEMYRSHGMDLMPIFCYSSAWNSPNAPADDVEANNFAAYAGELVGRYKDKVHYWEVWNEPNISQFWSPKPNADDYARLLRATRTTTIATDPKSKLVGCVTAGPDTQFIRKVLEAGAGDAFDILSIHNYFWTDEGIINDLRSIRALMSEFQQEKPIWITEIGWPTGKNWMSEEDQAKMLVRVFTLSLAEGVERLFYYNSTDYQPWDSGGWDGRTGLFDQGDIPKAAAVAYNELIWQLGGMKYGGKLNVGKGVYGRYFARGDEQTAVIWTTGSQRVTVSLPTNAPEVTVIDMLGRESFVKPEKGILSLSVTDRPQYVKLRGTALFVLSGADIVPERLFIGMEQEVDVTLRGAAVLHGKAVRLIAPTGWKVSPAVATAEEGDMGVRVCRFRVTIPQDVTPDTYELAAMIEGVSDLRIAKGIEVASPAKVTIIPPSELKPGYTKLKVSVENRCDRIIEGTITAGITGETPSVPTDVRLKPGASTDYRLNLPAPEAVGETEVTISATLDSDMSDVSDTVRLDPLAVVQPTGAIAVDGKLDDWAAVKPILTETGGTHVNQKGTWGGKADLGAKAWVAWKPTGLYLAVDVTDDVNVFPGDESVWEADSLQVAIDSANDAVSEGFDERNDFELEVGKINGQDRAVGLVAPKGVDLKGLEIAILAKPGGGAVYEMMIPRGILGLSPLETGRLIGFSFLVNDNDGQGRKSWLELTPGIGLGKDPTQYKDLWLR